MRNLTLGSLFDGSGGFPLGALLSGITPVFSSEIEPFPIRVTTKRIPFVKHYGDINTINGANLPPVDIVTFGSPCTNLSQAGKREGLNGEQSVLFFQAIRVIKEMRRKTNGKSPRFIVFENVPGVFSSGKPKGADFRIILSEIVKIKDKAIDVPMPENGKWLCAGEIVGDGFSIAYRTMDAQFYGVSQRRRRCFLVADFNGECAGQILFESESVSGYTPAGGGAWEGTAVNAESGVGNPSLPALNEQGMGILNNAAEIRCTEENDFQPIAFEPGAASRTGGHVWEGIAGTLRADMGDNQISTAIPINTQLATRHKALGKCTGFGIGVNGDPAFTLQAAHSHAVAVEHHPHDSRIKLNESGTVQMLTNRTVTGGNNVPLVMNERQYALTVGENVANTLTSTDYKGTQCVFEPLAKEKNTTTPPSKKGARSRNKDAGHKWMQLEIPYPLYTCGNGECQCNEPMVTAYGICSDSSNAMRSDNPNSGVYEADTSRTLDANGGNPACNQGAIAAVALQGSMIGRELKNGPNGSGVNEDICFTLTEADRHAVAYDCRNHTANNEMSAALQAKNNGGYSLNYINPVAQSFDSNKIEPMYAIRRLVPSECALLQGFPANWCAELETPEPTEKEIAWWSEVFETHRKAIGKSSKPKSRAHIIKWLKNPHSDSAEYKMWGNGVALPCVRFVLSGIAWAVSQEEQESINCPSEITEKA